jgi:acyl-coenzyme A synthetase/AMP-(fatty) acid ligase
MVPRRLHVMNRLPRNANGKFDRNAMLTMLGGGR